jgi:hypothetical protein
VNSQNEFKNSETTGKPHMKSSDIQIKPTLMRYKYLRRSGSQHLRAKIVPIENWDAFLPTEPIKPSRAILVLLAAFALAHTAISEASPTPTPNAFVSEMIHPVPKQLSYEITAQRIGTGDIIEFTPMNISWTLTVGKFGIVGPDPTPVDISVCPVINSPDSQFKCAEIHNASPGRTYRGTMSVPAPPAGKQSALRIVALKSPGTGSEDYGQRISVQETAVRVDAAARYDVALTSFEMLTTRSTSTDTVWLTLQGLIKSDPPHASDSPDACKLAGFNWCVFNQKYGDVHDSGVRIVENLRIGPYDLVPEREKDLRILFYLDNHGDSPWQAIGLAVANGFSKAGMIALGAYGGLAGNSNTGSFASGLDSVMEQFHDAAFASCDGKLAEDVVILANTTIANQSQNTLDAITRGAGTFTSPVLNNGVPKIYNETDGDARCDKRGGKYTVTYAVYRTSWRDWGFQPRW